MSVEPRVQVEGGAGKQASDVSFDFGPARGQIVSPTLTDRVHAYDLIRGIAVLGILLANIPFFAGPAFAEQATLAVQHGRDAVVEAWTTALVAGKFRSMLAILFGIGIWLQFQKRSKVEGNWPGGYFKRTLILALFGLIHGFLIWYGDILFLYACTAFVMCLFVGFQDRVLAWIYGLFAGFGLLIGIGIALFAFLGSPKLDFDAELLSMGISRARELAVYGHGNYLDQLQLRSLEFLISITSYAVFFPCLAALFSLGILVGRHQVLSQPAANKKWRNVMLLVGFGIGLPLNCLALIPLKSGGLFWLIQAVELSFGSILSVGIIMLLAIWAESGFAKALQRAIAKVGRTAFSNYILQSFLCTIIFYSWGFGWFGTLDRLQILATVPIVWACNFLFAHLWLRKYAIGPLEWLWRSWTEGKRLPLRAGS